MKNVEAAGVTFHLDTSQLKATVGDTWQGTASLLATVTDPELWDQVLKNFQGLKLYKGQDMKTHLITMLRNKTEAMEGQITAAQAEAQQAVERAEHEASLATAARASAEQKLRLAEARIQQLEQTVQQWQDWHTGHMASCPSGSS